ncbi:EAL domain-containing response regulator [Pseudomonas sp. TTU2014-080ASC]|uniref:EAL domain-containing response regulator n=1 Tax=Pseudomonas sp. TTU2014-080ASC TaxID=1729724 RepID=UPI000AB1BE33|nr:EAL domain-containing response regulator [Pseudomonas sp. TTU2014-080ASC]
MMQALTVLVLEDHAFQRALTVNALKHAGVGCIIEAADGQEAIDKLSESGGADVAICDLHMPGIDGPRFICQAFQQGLIKGVIISSDVDQPLRTGVASMISYLGLNLLGDLGKPLQAEQLYSLLSNFKKNDLHQPVPLPELHELPNPEEVIPALENGEFQAYYQPKMNIRTRKPQGAEVLARWLHPRLGLLNPRHFMPFVEANNLFEPLFNQLLKQGCELQRQLQTQGKQLELAYNLDPSQLASRNLTEDIRKMLTTYQLRASSLMFEVTESGLLSAPATSYENFVRLRLMGCGLAMDDFGTGYSSLRRLCELPFNQIKLDASFVQNTQKQPRSKAIIKTALTLASELDISLVVEGVETIQQHKIIEEMGCSLTQGFFYAGPMPADQLLSFIAPRQNLSSFPRHI